MNDVMEYSIQLKRRKDMGISLMLLAIVLFFIGYLTPIGNTFTFTLSLLLFVIAILRILQKRER
jgi:hypothetical protein